MYVGPNWRNTTPTYQPPNNDADDLPLRNVEIRFNEIDNTSWDMCNCKSWIAGDNRIHHNLMRRGSQALNPNQNGGITANNCHVKIYNNWVEKTGNPGIQTYMHQMPDSLPFGPFEAIIYNNVVCDLFTVPGDQQARASTSAARRAASRSRRPSTTTPWWTPRALASPPTRAARPPAVRSPITWSSTARPSRAAAPR